MPGAIIAMGRLNRPSIMIYGGTIAPGKYQGKDLNIVSAFEALGEKIAGKISEEEYKGIMNLSLRAQSRDRFEQYNTTDIWLGCCAGTDPQINQFDYDRIH